jgi:chromosome segregation ATPase
MSRLVVTGAIVTAVITGGAFVGSAQQPSTPSDVLSALLIEVRGLRNAMEQMAAAGPRVQLALGRLQLQEQRINNLARRLDSIRVSITEAQEDREKSEMMARDLQRASGEHRDAEGQQEIAQELKKWRARLARAEADVRRLTAEEAMLPQEIAAEQNRWSEINQRLEELDRGLGRR